jgi:hypothetical protein
MINADSTEVGMEIDNQEEKTFADFAVEFAAKHAISGPAGGTVTVDVTKEELMELGRAFVRIMVGWAAGLEASRARHREIAPPEWFTPVTVDAREEGRPRLTLVRQSKTVE